MTTLKEVFTNAPKWAKDALKEYLTEVRGISPNGVYYFIRESKVSMKDLAEFHRRACIGFDSKRGYFFDFQAAEELIKKQELKAGSFGMTV